MYIILLAYVVLCSTVLPSVVTVNEHVCVHLCIVLCAHVHVHCVYNYLCNLTLFPHTRVTLRLLSREDAFQLMRLGPLQLVVPVTLKNARGDGALLNREVTVLQLLLPLLAQMI